MTQRHATRRSNSLIDRTRQAASASLLVRSVLIGTIAIGVTIGGVLAGALVVAPVVARVTQPSAMNEAMRLTSGIGTTMVWAARSMASRSMELASGTLATLPAPVIRFALPGLVVLAVAGVLATLLVRRQRPARSLGATLSADTPISRLTPRTGSRVITNRQQTPRAVEALAASGATTSDIAWKTGLPIDAVRLLLAISAGTRQLQPPAA